MRRTDKYSKIQVQKHRGLASVSNDPLSRKVEMTNWEKVCFFSLPQIFRPDFARKCPDVRVAHADVFEFLLTLFAG